MCDSKPPETVIADALHRLAWDIARELADGERKDEPLHTRDLPSLLRAIADEIDPTP